MFFCWRFNCFCRKNGSISLKIWRSAWNVGKSQWCQLPVGQVCLWFLVQCKPLEFARDEKHEPYFYSILQVVIPVELLQHLQELVAKSYNFACLVAKWRCHHQAREIEHKRHLDISLWHRISFLSFNGQWLVNLPLPIYPSLTYPPQKQRFNKALLRETNH